MVNMTKFISEQGFVAICPDLYDTNHNHNNTTNGLSTNGHQSKVVV
jgi:dienelactone hydrolase